MTHPVIALVTARAARGTDPDMPPMLASLRAAGADAHEVAWDDDAVDWSRFNIALLRSTWDYFERVPEFLGWAERVSQQTRLLNPLDVIRWNTDKHYLVNLGRAGVAVVPGHFVEPGDDPEPAVDEFLLQPVPLTQRFAPDATRRLAPTDKGGGGDVVVKPAIGAGSRDAQRHARGARDAIIAHARRLLDANRSVLLQPYFDRVDEHGETSLLFFDGAFSHAIGKGPLLQRGAQPTTALYAPETIAPRKPTPEELALARRAVAAIPFPQPLLYARVDLVQADDGSPRVLELELVEPSVFVAHAEGAADRFARAIVQRVR
ncbi:MAG: ATP-grasp domain-containing protein [Rhodanobacteraceae bacterium]